MKKSGCWDYLLPCPVADARDTRSGGPHDCADLCSVTRSVWYGVVVCDNPGSEIQHNNRPMRVFADREHDVGGRLCVQPPKPHRAVHAIDLVLPVLVRTNAVANRNIRSGIGDVHCLAVEPPCVHGDIGC
jgi:hypothetical protein